MPITPWLSDRERAGPLWIRRLVTEEEVSYIDALVADEPWAIELAGSNTALFFLLIREARERRLDVPALRKLIRRPRRELLAFIGGDSSRAAEHVLRRFAFNPEDTLGDAQELALRALLAQPPAAWLTHWKKPCINVLTQVRFRHWPLVASMLQRMDDAAARVELQVPPDRLFRHRRRVAADNDQRVEDLVETLRLLDIRMDAADIDENPAQVRREVREQLDLLAHRGMEANLHRLHLDAVLSGRDAWDAGVRQLARTREWPAAPLPGDGNIEPLDSPEQLILEGRELRHCIPTYAARILDGGGYAYRMMSPERATLFVRRAKGKWEIEQMRLASNRMPSEASFAMAREWLSKVAGRQVDISAAPSV